jgi:hypothetical protein
MQSQPVLTQPSSMLFFCRRQARASKQLGGRVMADTDRAFSEGADVEQWQRWAVGPSGLGTDGSGRAGKR